MVQHVVQASRLASLVVLLPVFLLAISLSGAGDASAAEDGDREAAVQIEATLGFGDVVPPSPFVPLQVDLTPAEPVSGRLLVAVGTDTGRVVERRRLDLPAGADRRYRFLVPRGFDLRVQFVPDAGGEVVTVRPAVGRTGRHVVAALGATTLPAGITVPVTQATVDQTQLDPDWLDAGAEVLSGVDAVVTTRGELVALSDPRRRTLEAAVTAGMQLLVVDVSDPDLGLRTSPVLDDLTPVPGAWATTASALLPVVDESPSTPTPGPAPGADTIVATMVHGRGAVTVVTDDVTDRGDLVSAVLRPRDRRELIRTRDLTTFGSQAVLQGSVGGLVGLPPVWALALGMGAYVLLVGPVNALVLGRLGRRELAWLTVPGITVVVIAVTAVLAGGVGGSGLERQALSWLDGSGTATTIIGVQSTGRDVTEVALDGGGWAVSPIGFQSQAIIEREPDATRVQLELASREAGGIRATRSLDELPPLTVEAAVVDDVLRLEVTNTLDTPVSDVTARVAGADRRLADTLAAGQTLVEQVDLPPDLPTVPRIEPFGQFDEFGEFVQRDPAEGDASAREFFVERGALAAVDPLPGVVWIFADVPATAISASGGRIDGRTTDPVDVLLAVGVTPTATDAATSAYETPQRLIDARLDQLGVQAPATLFGEGSFILAFDLPREGELTDLVSQLGPRQDAERCVQVDRSGPDVPNGFETRRECGPDVTTDIECVPEAINCSIGPDYSEVCLPDGTCESRYIDGPHREGVFRLEVWDPPTRTWTAAEAELPLSAVDPLGRVVVRLLDTFELDLTGRGLGGTIR